jgi:hypothetical protein
MDPIILSPPGTPPPRSLGTQLHPSVRDAANDAWAAGRYVQAVERARRAGIDSVRVLTRRSGGSDAEVLAEAFSMEAATEATPRLRWYLDVDSGSHVADLLQRIRERMRESAMTLVEPVDLRGYRGSPRDGEWRVALAQIGFASNFATQLDACVLVTE